MNILVIAAHPDDEVLGCGATMAAHARAGDRVDALILAQGISSRGGPDAERSLSMLRQAAEHANGLLGTASLTLHDFPDNRMDSLALLDVVKTVEGFVRKSQPDVIYTHHAGDLNIDHCIVHDAVVTACRPMPGHITETLLFFEVPSSTEWQAPGVSNAFAPNWFVDSSETLDIKLKALSAYGSEMRAWPHARSLRAVEHLARWRGASVGLDAAEAFVMGRSISRLRASRGHEDT